jgi:hypothetical protein
MSTVTIIIPPNNNVPNQPAQTPAKQAIPAPSQTQMHRHYHQKDSYGMRRAYGFFGFGAIVAGVYGLFKSAESGDKFFHTGKSGEIFEKAGAKSHLSPEAWGKAIKACPKVFATSAAIALASWSSIFIGAKSFHRYILGHKPDRKRH